MSRLNKPLLLATISVAVVALFVCQSVYWLRIGSEGSVSKVEEREDLDPAVAKATTMSRFKQPYDSHKEYEIANVYQETIKRGFFPMTYKERVHLDGPILVWEK